MTTELVAGFGDMTTALVAGVGGMACGDAATSGFLGVLLSACAALGYDIGGNDRALGSCTGSWECEGADAKV